MKLSKLTLGFGLYIIISASFTKQVWDFLSKIFGQNNIKITCMLLFVLVAAFVLTCIIKSHSVFFKTLMSVVILCSAFVFLLRLSIFVEKIHVLEYGLLGWLATRDLNKNKISLKKVLMAMLFVFLVGALDEIFQKCLPYRVGEIRDVTTNLVSGGLGIMLFVFR